MQIAPDDAEPAARPGRRDGAVWPRAVDLRGVHKHFGSVQAVRGVALAVGFGEVMAFLGPNGAGKTSTIDMILGLSRPDAGEVEVYGMAPRQAVRRGLVSAVMQSTKRLIQRVRAACGVPLFASSAGPGSPR
jgi:ABC-2 type transport system ATP-binding protein